MNSSQQQTKERDGIEKARKTREPSRLGEPMSTFHFYRADGQKLWLGALVSLQYLHSSSEVSATLPGAFCFHDIHLASLLRAAPACRKCQGTRAGST